jgi:sortase A
MISLFSSPVEHLPHKTATGIALISSWLLIVIGTVLIACAGYAIIDASVYQNAQVMKLESWRPQPPAAKARNSIARVAEGEVIGELQVPRLRLKAIVAEGVSPRILRRAVGHIPNTAMPGESGNIGLAGHRDSFFRALRDVRVGDVISIRTMTQELRYEVQSVRIVSPHDTSVLTGSPATELTLITCFPFDYIGAAPDRFVVRARKITQSP